MVTASNVPGLEGPIPVPVSTPADGEAKRSSKRRIPPEIGPIS